MSLGNCPCVGPCTCIEPDTGIPVVDGLPVPNVGLGQVCVTSYGADPTGVFNSAPAFQAAFSALHNVGVVIVPPGTYQVSSFTVPADITIWFQGGAGLSVIGSQTVAVNGAVYAQDRQQLFAYVTSGTPPAPITQPVVFANTSPQKYVSVYWFGAAGDGVTDEYTALQTAINAYPQQCYFPPGSFQIRSLPVLVPTATSVHLFGAGYESKILSNQDLNPHTGSGQWPENGGANGVYAYGLIVFIGTQGPTGGPPTSTGNSIEVDHLCFIGNTIATNNDATTDGYCNPNMLMFNNYDQKVSVHHNYWENGQNNAFWASNTVNGLPASGITGDIIEDLIFSDNHISNWGWNAFSPGPYSSFNYTLTGPVCQLTGRNITVANNTFYQVSNGMMCSGRKISITGNVIREFLNQAIAAGDIWNVDDVTIVGNTIETTLHSPYNSSTSPPSGSYIGISIIPPLSGGTNIDTVTITGNSIRFKTNADAPWTTATAYTFNQTPTFVSNGGNVYRLHSAGTSSTGPSGTSTTTPTGTGATWLYVEPLNTSSLAAGISVIDAVATIVGNSVTMAVANTQTTHDLVGILVTNSDTTKLAVCKVASNVVRFTGPATNYSECIGIQALSQVASLVTVYSGGNIVQGLGINPPNASNTYGQTAGTAYNFASPSPPGSVLVYVDGDVADGGTIALGTSSLAQFNVPIRACVDTRPQAWQEGLAYVPGLYVTNSSNVYLCTVAGTSNNDGGPVGTGTNVPEPGGGTPPSWSYVGLSNVANWGVPENMGTLPVNDPNVDGTTNLLCTDPIGGVRKGYTLSHFYTLFHDILGGDSYQIGTSGSPVSAVNCGGNITSGIGDAGQDQIKIGGQLRANYTGGVVNSFAAGWTAGSGTISVETVTGGDPSHYIDVETTGGTPTQINAGTAVFTVQLNQAYAGTAAFVAQVTPRNAATAAVGQWYAIGASASTYKIYCTANFTPAANTLYEWGVLTIGTS